VWWWKNNEDWWVMLDMWFDLNGVEEMICVFEICLCRWLWIDCCDNDIELNGGIVVDDYDWMMSLCVNVDCDLICWTIELWNPGKGEEFKGRSRWEERWENFLIKRKRGERN